MLLPVPTRLPAESIQVSSRRCHFIGVCLLEYQLFSGRRHNTLYNVREVFFLPSKNSAKKRTECKGDKQSPSRLSVPNMRRTTPHVLGSMFNVQHKIPHLHAPCLICHVPWSISHVPCSVFRAACPVCFVLCPMVHVQRNCPMRSANT